MRDMSALSDISRMARRVPVVRDVIEASDPRRRAERLARWGIIDTHLYAVQLGVDSISVEDAASHYATEGFRLGYTLNVLTDPYVLRRAMIRTDRPSIYDYFNSRAWHARTTGVWSAALYIAENPDAVEHPTGPVGHLWERVTRDPSTEITIEPGGARTFAWSEIYPVLVEATAEWARLQRDRQARYPRPTLDHPPVLPASDSEPANARVSIIMPVWNRAGAMRAAVESVIAQTWIDWELLIIDDGSWDDTIAVADLLARRDSRITLLRQDHLGVCAARNTGIESATGEFIAFLDSDNTWKPTFLHDMVTSMSRDGLTSAYATIALDDGSTVRYRYGSPAAESLILGNSIDLNTLVARRDAILAVGGFDASLRRAVDYDLILKLAAHAPIVHVPTLGAHYDNSDAADDRISTTEAVGWNTAVRLRHIEIAQSGPETASTAVILLQRHDPFLNRKLEQIQTMPDDADVRFVAIGLKPDEWRQIRAAVLSRANASAALHQSGEPFAFVVDTELMRSRSAVFAVVDPRSLFTGEDISTLVAEVSVDGAAATIPLTLRPDGTVDSMGATLAASLGHPIALLGGHPGEDARRLGERVGLSSLSGRTFAIRRELLSRAGGLDPLLHNAHELVGLTPALADEKLVARTDVVLPQMSTALEFTSSDERGTAATLEALLRDTEVDDPNELYTRLDLRINHWQRTAESRDVGLEPVDERLVPIVTRDRRTVTVDGRTVPRLRWAIKTASPAGPRGETWGDTHFGRSLAAALESLGQEAVVDARTAQRRETDYLDDVVVQLRGLDLFAPSPGTLSYLWIISHPDMVTRAEAQRFDRVFAASLSWSEQQTMRWGFPVAPLLQCTDPELFQSHGTAERKGILFVGNSRGIPRPTVMESVRAGLPLELYGGDWTRFIPETAIAGERVDNSALGGMYAKADVVLNDHWADMQREGFISNRLFDVVAAGGRAFSDEVAGIAEIFGGAVQTYRTLSEIIPFLESDLDDRFPGDSELAAISTRVREEHSFAARARVLLDNAIEDIAKGTLR
jgi:O-antigen biosynthesis protein